MAMMARKPRVLVLTPDFPPARGGIQLLVHRIVEGWQRVEGRVVTLGAAGRGSAELAGAAAVVRMRVPAIAGHRGGIAALNARAVLEACRWRPDLVLCGHLVAAPAGEMIGRILGIPYVQYLHGSEMSARPGLVRRAAASAAIMVVVSDHSERMLRALATPRGAVRRISPGVDLPARIHSSRSATPLVVTVTRLAERYKGVEVLIRSLPLVRATVPGSQLVIVGDGPLRPGLEALASALRLGDAVRFVGAVDNDERDRWLDTAHVFAMVSRLDGDGASEGFGIVYLEAGVHQLPVVAGSSGGATDAVVHGVTGLLVDAEDHVAVADALAGLLGNRERAEAVGCAGAERAATHAWPIISRRVEDALLACIEG
jgi:phosphatidylinositol alpha-1,6-mannosyltransferase